MEDKNEIKFTCEECGKKFEPDLESMLEGFIDIFGAFFEEEGEEWKEAAHPSSPISFDEVKQILQNMSPEEMDENGITSEMRDKLVNGERVVVGGMSICCECQ